ncbi:winged helix-turn-helix domain-containing protein [Enterococcus quebecensis]|uniref:Transcriptional regulator n=1 Tax=Enterococcus quebecensis TaxID=903983 RepID=A0A1E5GUV7_9ENTE|nr:winged helix-turn-helix domain-containing protein [Enterococcus quebecensis]OEG16484.1 transcriptional regulator [Enterococcus quebecensis]
MFTIGCLSEKELEENAHLNFLTEKGWNLQIININDPLKNQYKLDAIVICESSMPKICRWLMELKVHASLPIYLLSEIDESHSNIVYLQLGVEACFSTKMDPEELYYTLTNLLRHYSSENNQLLGNRPESSQEKGIELISHSLSVLIDGKNEISLTKKEYSTLEILYSRPCKTISYEEFQEKLWRFETDLDGRNYRIANLIFHLRKKIESSGSDSSFIKTVRSKGYMLYM